MKALVCFNIPPFVSWHRVCLVCVCVCVCVFVCSERNRDGKGERDTQRFSPNEKRKIDGEMKRRMKSR